MSAPTRRLLAVPPVPYSTPDSDWFASTDGVRLDLRGKSVRSGFLQIGSQAVQVLLLVSSAMVLARLLKPEDFGLFAMVVSLTAFVRSFQDFGLSMATVHQERVDHLEVSALFWVTLGLNALLALFMALMAPLLARFYGEARLTTMTLVMTVAVFALAVTTQHQSLLIRQMRFGILNLIDIGSLLAGIGVAVTTALLGAGYWALVYQLVVMYVAKSAALWVVTAWRPARYTADVRGRTPAVRPMLSYGAYLTGFRVAAHVGRNLDRLLVGYFSGATAVGLYDSSSRWSLYPVDQVTIPLSTLVVASLSRVRAEPAAYRAACRGAFLPIYSIVMPALAFMFVQARDVILVLLGHQWLAAAPLFRLMCIAAFATSVTRITGWLYLAEGETKRQFRWALFHTPVMVLAVVLAAPWGAYGVAVGITAATCLLAYPTVAYCLRSSHLGMRDVLAILSRPVLASLGAAAALFAGQTLLSGGRGVILDVLVKLMAFGLLYAALWVGIPGGKRSSAELLRLGQEILPERFRADSKPKRNTGRERRHG